MKANMKSVLFISILGLLVSLYRTSSSSAHGNSILQLSLENAALEGTVSKIHKIFKEKTGIDIPLQYTFAQVFKMIATHHKFSGINTLSTTEPKEISKATSNILNTLKKMLLSSDVDSYGEAGRRIHNVLKTAAVVLVNAPSIKNFSDEIAHVIDNVVGTATTFFTTHSNGIFTPEAPQSVYQAVADFKRDDLPFFKDWHNLRNKPSESIYLESQDSIVGMLHYTEEDEVEQALADIDLLILMNTIVSGQESSFAMVSKLSNNMINRLNSKIVETYPKGTQAVVSLLLKYLVNNAPNSSHILGQKLFLAYFSLPPQEKNPDNYFKFILTKYVLEGFQYTFQENSVTGSAMAGMYALDLVQASMQPKKLNSGSSSDNPEDYAGMLQQRHISLILLNFQQIAENVVFIKLFHFAHIRDIIAVGTDHPGPYFTLFNQLYNIGLNYAHRWFQDPSSPLLTSHNFARTFDEYLNWKSTEPVQKYFRLNTVKIVAANMVAKLDNWIYSQKMFDINLEGNYVFYKVLNIAMNLNYFSHYETKFIGLTVLDDVNISSFLFGSKLTRDLMIHLIQSLPETDKFGYESLSNASIKANIFNSYTNKKKILEKSVQF